MQSYEKNMPESHYPQQLTDALKTELDSLHKREARLDDGLLGLLSGGPDETACQTADHAVASNQ
jgi:hypothetical protein